jgi:HlyD family secretion protein
MAKKSKKKFWILLIISIVVLALIGLMIFQPKDHRISVTTTKVDTRTITQTVSALGKIQPEMQVKISSQTSGEIIFLGVKEGDTVKQNQLLVRIKPDIVEAQLKQAQATAEAAKMEIGAREAEKDRAAADFKRIQDLFKKEFASKKDFDAAEAAFNGASSSYKAALARYQSALAQLNQVERDKDRTSIFSPIAGVVTTLGVELGEKVVGTGMMQGTELMQVSDLSIMNALVNVDENDIVLVSIGDTAHVEIDAISDKKLRGVVIEIGHSAITSQLGSQDQVVNFQIKVRLIDNEFRLRPGMSCNVEIQTETRHNVLAVPLQAVTVRDASLNQTSNSEMKDGSEHAAGLKIIRPPSVVFLSKAGKAVLTPVKTGISDKGFIEIIEGLNSGDEIISGSFVAVSKELADGMEIKIDTAMQRKLIKK